MKISTYRIQVCFCLYSTFLPVTRSFHPFRIRRRLIFELISESYQNKCIQKSRINLLDCLSMFYFCLNRNSPMFSCVPLPCLPGRFVFVFYCFTSQVKSYGHGGTVSSPNHIFSWEGLNKWSTSGQPVIWAHTFACN